MSLAIALRRRGIEADSVERSESSVSEAAGLRVRYGVRVQALQQYATHVSVVCSDGSLDCYALVVGADGVRSTIRSQTNRRDRMRTLAPALRDMSLRLLWRRLYVANYAPLLNPP